MGPAQVAYTPTVATGSFTAAVPAAVAQPVQLPTSGSMVMLAPQQQTLLPSTQSMVAYHPAGTASLLGAPATGTVAHPGVAAAGTQQVAQHGTTAAAKPGTATVK